MYNDIAVEIPRLEIETQVKRSEIWKQDIVYIYPINLKSFCNELRNRLEFKKRQVSQYKIIYG